MARGTEVVIRWIKVERTLQSSLIMGPYREVIINPGFPNTMATTQKQSDYKVEQSSFTLIALFLPEIGCCHGGNWLNGNQASVRLKFQNVDGDGSVWKQYSTITLYKRSY